MAEGSRVISLPKALVIKHRADTKPSEDEIRVGSNKAHDRIRAGDIPWKEPFLFHFISLVFPF